MSSHCSLCNQPVEQGLGLSINDSLWCLKCFTQNAKQLTISIQDQRCKICGSMQVNSICQHCNKTCYFCNQIVETNICAIVVGNNGTHYISCPSCVKKNLNSGKLNYCQCCGCLFVKSNNHSTTCYHCLENMFFCFDCSSWKHEVWKFGYDSRCKTCAIKISPVKDYNSNPLNCLPFYHTSMGQQQISWQPANNSLKYYGIELEVSSKIARNDLAKDCLDVFDNFSITKHDGSIPRGFEIVTAPATLENHYVEWGKFFENISDLQSRGLGVNTSCGLHIHVSRQALKKETLGKVIEFFYGKNAWNFISVIARRNLVGHRYARIDRNYGYNLAFETIDHVQAVVTRYSALNLRNRDTIEFRIFRSTLKKENLFGALEFCDAIINYCDNTELEAINVDGFKSYVINSKYEFLKKYMINLKLIKKEEIALARKNARIAAATASKASSNKKRSNTMNLVFQRVPAFTAAVSEADND